MNPLISFLIGATPTPVSADAKLPVEDYVRPGDAAGEPYDRKAVAQIAEAYDVTATGVVIAGPCIIFAIETIATGTSSTLTLHDHASSASGKVILPAIPTGTINVLGYQRQIVGGGAGGLCVNGLYATVGGTGSPTFRVWAVPVAP
jgi:hypothetical protein